jgi:hypothetical protein
MQRAQDVWNSISFAKSASGFALTYELDEDSHIPTSFTSFPFPQNTTFGFTRLSALLAPLPTKTWSSFRNRHIQVFDDTNNAKTWTQWKRHVQTLENTLPRDELAEFFRSSLYDEGYEKLGLSTSIGTHIHQRLLLMSLGDWERDGESYAVDTPIINSVFPKGSASLPASVYESIMIPRQPVERIAQSMQEAIAKYMNEKLVSWKIIATEYRIVYPFGKFLSSPTGYRFFRTRIDFVAFNPGEVIVIGEYKSLIGNL